MHLYLVGAAPTRPLIGIVRMAQTTGAAKIVLKISRTLLDQANGKADPQLTAAYNISAEWWGLTEVSATPNNARSHWTGSDKGHTALLMVKPRTGEQARLLASAPKTSWHGGGVLNDEVGASKTFRDTLVGRHTKILRPQDRLSTTLEGESEYRIEKTQYDAALAALRELARTPNLGFTVTEMTGGKTQDTYYDFDDGTLFKRKVLLRRRYVAANDKGKDLFLFAIKARSLSKEGLMVRLSSQLNMSERKVGNQLQELTTLLLEDGWNPFAQIAKDGIGRDTNMGELKKKVLKKVLIIHSTRQKFAITNIKDKPGQSIDVTLDGAYGVRDGKKTSTV